MSLMSNFNGIQPSIVSYRYLVIVVIDRALFLYLISLMPIRSAQIVRIHRFNVESPEIFLMLSQILHFLNIYNTDSS